MNKLSNLQLKIDMVKIRHIKFRGSHSELILSQFSNLIKTFCDFLPNYSETLPIISAPKSELFPRIIIWGNTPCDVITTFCYQV